MPGKASVTFFTSPLADRELSGSGNMQASIIWFSKAAMWHFANFLKTRLKLNIALIIVQRSWSADTQFLFPRPSKQAGAIVIG